MSENRRPVSAGSHSRDDKFIAYAITPCSVEAMEPYDPCLCGRLRRASRTLTRLYDAALAPVEMTVTQFSILRRLSRMERPTLAELAEATAHEKSGLWRTIQPLIRDGSIEATQDGRSQRLALGEAGMVRLVRALPLWREAQGAVDKALGPRGKVLIDLLGEIETRV